MNPFHKRGGIPVALSEVEGSQERNGWGILHTSWNLQKAPVIRKYRTHPEPLELVRVINSSIRMSAGSLPHPPTVSPIERMRGTPTCTKALMER